MRLCGESLACVAMLDDVLGIVEGRKPVEPRSKSLSDEGSAAGMMPAGSFMNISEKGDSVLACYAPLENPCGATFVEFSVDYREGLGTLHDLSTMDGVFWEFDSYQVGQVIALVVMMKITNQLRTPRGRYDEHSSKFSLSKKPRFYHPEKSQYSRR
jgi:hypothetical protein